MYNILKNKKKLVRTQNKALFLLAIVIIAIFFINLPAKADDIGNYYYRIDFEDYQLGYLHGQFNWISSNGKAKIEEIQEVVPNKIVNFHNGYDWEKIYTTFNNLDYRDISFRIVDLGNTPIISVYLNNYISSGTTGIFARIDFEKTETGYNIYAWNGGFNNENKILVYENPSIENLEIEWKNIFENYYYRIKLLGYDWSPYFKTIENREAELYYFEIKANAGGYLKIDDIYYSQPVCNINNCEACGNSTDCENVGCYWNWSNMFCEYQELDKCGSGSNLIFCDNEIDCVNAGGYWINGTCFETPPSEPSDFLNYYSQNTSEKYPNPTDFVVNLADFFTPVFETLSGYLLKFDEKFNLASASKYGIMTGEAIAESKNYVSVINDFFNGLPIGEAIFIYIIFSIILIIIKIIYRIIKLIK